MHPTLGNSSPFETYSLEVCTEVVGQNSAGATSSRTATRTGNEVQEKEHPRPQRQTPTMVLLAMRPTCARSEYQASLVSQGFTTITVDNAEQGLRVLQETLPSLVVVEPELEGGSGDRLLDAMQREMRFQQVPVFVVSGAANRSAIFRVAQFKIDDFAILPIGVGVFTIRVLKLLNGFTT